MAETRPSGASFVEEKGLLQEVTEIDARGRLHLLSRWTDRVVWMRTQRPSEMEALMVFREPGLLSISDPAAVGPKILGRYEEITLSTDDPDLEIRRLIHDRYARLTIPRDWRPYLGDAALAHLGLSISRDKSAVAYVVVFNSRVDVLTPALRNSRLIRGHPMIDDLP